MYTGQLRWPLKSWWWDRLGWRSSLGVAQRCPSPIVGHLAPLAPALVQAHTKLQGLEKVVKLDLEALCWWPSPMWWVVAENTSLCVDVWYFQICFWFWEFPLCSHGDSRHGSGVASTWTRRHQQWVGLGNQTSASETTSTRIFMKKSSLSEPTPKPNTSEGKIIKQTSASLSMSLHLYKIGVTSGKNLATKYPY